MKVEVGELLCRVGRPVTYWFGEGMVIKREAYCFNIEALRPSLVAGLSVDTFHWLLDCSILFNRFSVQQLDERRARSNA